MAYITRQEAVSVLYDLINTGILSGEIEVLLEEMAHCVNAEDDGLFIWGADEEVDKLYIAVREDLQNDEYEKECRRLYEKYRIKPRKKQREIEFTPGGNNAAIKVNILSDEEMREIGFTDRSKKTWYFTRRVAGSISFNFHIEKETGRWGIDILDEDFLQPYDYQYLIANGYKDTFVEEVQEGVEEIMAFLAEKGVIEGHEYGEYI